MKEFSHIVAHYLEQIVERTGLKGFDEIRAEIEAAVESDGEAQALALAQLRTRLDALALGQALTADDCCLLIAALDSHLYWQLSDEHYRNDGMVLDPGSDDADVAATIARCRALQDRLELAK